MRLIASREKTVKNVEAILNDSDHRQFTKALEFAADRGYGKPVRAEDVVERVEKTLAVIRKHVSPEQAVAIAAELRPIWV
jgi:hypothetical protein